MPAYAEEAERAAVGYSSTISLSSLEERWQMLGSCPAGLHFFSLVHPDLSLLFCEVPRIYPVQWPD